MKIIDDESLVRSHELASDHLKRLANGGAGQIGPRNVAEDRYGETYQQLVKRGLAPQLKRKYRR